MNLEAYKCIHDHYCNENHHKTPAIHLLVIAALLSSLSRELCVHNSSETAPSLFVKRMNPDQQLRGTFEVASETWETVAGYGGDAGRGRGGLDDFRRDAFSDWTFQGLAVCCGMAAL